MPKGDRAIGKADPEDGTAPIANLLLEALAMAHLSGEEKGAVLFLWRRTYGWVDGDRRRTESLISLPEWAAALDTSKDYSARIVKQLVQKRIIIQRDLGKGRGFIYSMNTRVNQWDNSSLNSQLLFERYNRGLAKKYKPDLINSSPNGLLPPKETTPPQKDYCLAVETNPSRLQSPKKTTVQWSKRTTPPDTNLVSPKERLNKVKESNKGRKRPPDPVIAEIFEEMRSYLGFPKLTTKDPIPNYGKEGNFIRRLLTRGFTREEILSCWKGKVSQRGGEFVSMTWVNEDIGKPSRGRQNGTHQQNLREYSAEELRHGLE